jgi:hypothetical protein
MLTDRVIAEGSLRNDDRGFSFDLRLPWYRSLALSCVEGLDVVVDGDTVAARDVRIAFDGTTYTLDELPPLYESLWNVTDPAHVSIARVGGLDAGKHELDVTLSVRIPYIVEEGRRLVMQERCVKTLELEAGS